MSDLKKYITLAILFFWRCVTIAQTGFYVPSTGKIFFKGDTATIFSDVTNYGRFGVGKNAFVNFSGKVWKNDPQSLMTDETNGITGSGGWIRFLSDSFRQQINGGYNTATKTGPSFSNLMIQNSVGVELSQSNAKVRKEISFSKGLVYLQDYIFVTGDNNPGKITGYDSLRYFVTGNKPGTGFLIRENIHNSNGRIDFPVGSRNNSYTPAAIQSNSNNGDDFYVSVFDTVKSSVFTGDNLADESVNKTWQIGKLLRAGLDDAQITLQHINADEGNLFSKNRQFAYVSQFNGSAWDTAPPKNYPGPGYITSGTALTNSGTNSRIFSSSISAASYFTKLTDTSDKFKKTILWFNAYRLDTGNVYTYWNTNPEINVKLFVVQRRLSNETNFRSVATVFSQAGGGYSFTPLNYSAIDPNNYRGISFYRLLVLSYTNDSTYSDTVAVGNKPGEYSFMIWPNPTPNVFYVSVGKTLPVKAIVIWNAIGQKIREESTNGRSIIQMSGLIPGTYFVGVVLTTDYIIQTKKLVVTGY